MTLYGYYNGDQGIAATGLLASVSDLLQLVVANFGKLSSADTVPVEENLLWRGLGSRHVSLDSLEDHGFQRVNDLVLVSKEPR